MFKKTVSLFLILTLALCVCLTACGKKNEGAADQTGKEAAADEKTEAADLAGKTETWGVFSVFVPEGLEFSPGDAADAEDPKACAVKDPANPLKYCIFCATSKEDAKGNIETTREMNADDYDVKDVEPFTTGENTWEGITYSDPDGSWTVYSLVSGEGDNAVYLMMCGFDPADDVTAAVLSSVTLVDPNA